MCFTEKSSPSFIQQTHKQKILLLVNLKQLCLEFKIHLLSLKILLSIFFMTTIVCNSGIQGKAFSIFFTSEFEVNGCCTARRERLELLFLFPLGMLQLVTDMYDPKMFKLPTTESTADCY